MYILQYNIKNINFNLKINNFNKLNKWAINVN